MNINFIAKTQQQLNKLKHKEALFGPKMVENTQTIDHNIYHLSSVHIHTSSNTFFCQLCLPKGLTTQNCTQWQWHIGGHFCGKDKDNQTRVSRDKPEFRFGIMEWVCLRVTN